MKEYGESFKEYRSINVGDFIICYEGVDIYT